jgi:hypothetical protein
MRRGLAGQRLVVVFLAGVVLFNYPVLMLFDRPQLSFGFPLLYVFVFVMWAALIALIAWIAERGTR